MIRNHCSSHTIRNLANCTKLNNGGLDGFDDAIEFNHTSINPTSTQSRTMRGAMVDAQRHCDELRTLDCAPRRMYNPTTVQLEKCITLQCDQSRRIPCVYSLHPAATLQFVDSSHFVPTHTTLHSLFIHTLRIRQHHIQRHRPVHTS